ncbi:MAG TPA: twin-arginine translocation signal domain-containing protein [Candidatus Dormibacteraeota bacterium]|nr:twin-arginine translocation signal domain-containing protein [Candidatus Dormibacteraeota bacterium]
MTSWLVERTGAALARRTSRRGFLARSSLAATALAVAPAEYILRPVSAYAAVCHCAQSNCHCGQGCCDGYTDFCCTINHGSNTCPPGSFAGGWWKADGSAFCSGPRYYIDCMAECDCTGGCGEGGIFCGPSCDGLDCQCAHGDCNHRAVGCVSFRYGQCHTEVACTGRIVCRMVTCTPAYLVDNSCSTSSFTDEATANHNDGCLQAPPVVVRSFGFAPRTGGGVWMCSLDGGVFTFDGAPFLGSMGGKTLSAPVVAMASTPTGGGYWLVASDGGVFNFGDAAFLGSMGARQLYAPVVGMAATPTGAGYWLVASDGGVFCFGDAGFHGSIGGTTLTAPVVGLAPTPTGLGYWMVASDGGVFSFGDAGFFGSMGARDLSAPVWSIVATPSGQGYYLLGQDGAVYTFGDAVYRGSYRSAPPDASLLGGGVDSFYGMTVQGVVDQISGYTLFATAGRQQPPPQLRQYSF